MSIVERLNEKIWLSPFLEALEIHHKNVYFSGNPCENCQGCTLFIKKLQSTPQGSEALNFRFCCNPPKFEPMRVCIKTKCSNIPLSICDASVDGNGKGTIAVITNPDHQRKGYATLAIMRMVNTLKKINIKEIYIDTAYTNLTVQALATKLGLQPDIEFNTCDEKHSDFVRMVRKI